MIVHCPKCGGDFHINVTDPKAWLEMYRERTAAGVPVLQCFDCGNDRRPRTTAPGRDPWLDAPLTPHECLQSGAFEMCPREECSRCAAAELVGRSTDPNGLSGYVAIECVCDQIPEDARPCLPCEMRGANTPETTSPDSTKGAR